MRNLVLLLFSLVLFSGCKKDESNPVENSNSTLSQEIMPLKVGNTWEFQVTRYDSNNVVISTRNYTRTVSVEKVIETEKWYLIGNDYYTNRADGLWIKESSESAQAVIVTKYPVSLGEVFWRGSTYWQKKCLSLNEEIIVNNNKYNCIHYESYDNTSYHNDEYWSKGIGPVKFIHRSMFAYYANYKGPYYEIEELKSYTIK